MAINIMTSLSDDDNIQEFVKQLPKIELHAHLSGCVRDSTLAEISTSSSLSSSALSFLTNKNSKTKRSLSECFEIFQLIHEAISTPDILERVLIEALEDFLVNGVCYLELRSTPRTIIQQSTKKVLLTKKEYIQLILTTMEKFEKQNLSKIVIRYIISIDRSKSLEEAWENVKVGIDECSTRIVGVDIGGNPTKGVLSTFFPVLQYAKSNGLSTSIHLGEVPNQHNENESVLSSSSSFDGPDRLGHALFCSFDDLKKTMIPIECCPTSNIMTVEMVKSLVSSSSSRVHALRDKHPLLKFLLRENYPFLICTDDPGVFQTNSCQEYELVMRAFPNIATRDYMKTFVLNSINFIFDENIRAELELTMKSKLQDL